MPTPVAALVAFVTSLCLTPLVVALLRRRQQLDVPNERSSHVRPTPRGGGIAILVGAVGAACVADAFDSRVRTAVVVTALLFGAIGLGDDVRSMSAPARLALQLGAALVGAWLLLHDLTGPLVWQVAFASVCVAWLVSYVNAFNFMDGINGISVVQAVLAGATWVVGGWMEERPALVVGGAVVAAAALAFAPFNFPSAQVFLGDVGSYFLGGWIAGGTVVALRVGVAPELAVAPVALYLADTSTTIVRRVRAGERWTTAHRSHAYQRLIDVGWSHARTTACVAALITACIAIAAAGAGGPLLVRLLTSAAVLAIVVAYVRLPESLAARRVTA